MRPDSPKVLVERRGHVGIVTINRPEVRNAVDPETTELMAAAFDGLEADGELRVLIVTGAGDKAFSAGGDLKSVATRTTAGDPGARQRALGGFAGITGRTFTKPLIAAVNGFALGGGTEICLACDLVVAEEHAVFGLPEVTRGIVAGAGGLERLARRVPLAVALELVLTAERIDARRALELGLINRVVPTGTGLDAAIVLAERIGDAAPLSVRYSKAVMRASAEFGADEAVNAHRGLLEMVFASVDSREGGRAFAERRAPVWSGR